MAALAYRHEEVRKTPRGYRVRSIKRGSHVVRVAFPPGARKKGAGKVVEILHPKSESNPSCIVSNQARKNPGELLIFGNPASNRSHGNPAKGKKFDIYGRTFRGETEAEAKKRAHRAHDLRGRRAAKKTLRKLERGNPSRRRKDRRNPSDTQQAVRLFEKFHGRDPKEIAEKHVSAAMRKDYTALGDLERLKVLTPLRQTAQFNFEDDGVKLASSPDGKQLYCIGGNQNLSSCLDKESLEKDFIDLGECVEVQYLARKVHANFEPVSWYHKFGEKTGARPQLAYDKLKRQIFFVGGEYFIDTKAGVSPGIEN